MANRYLFVILVVGMMWTAGCGTRVHEAATTDSSIPMTGAYQVVETKVTSSSIKVPTYVPVMIKDKLDRELTQRGLMQENERQVSLRVDLKDYRDRGTAKRVLLGVFAGSDNLESTVELVDIKSSQVIATSTVKSFNVMAIGDMEHMASQHAEEIAKYIQGLSGGS